MIIEKESADAIYNGCTVVGTDKIPLAGLGRTLTKGVLLRAPGTNDPSPNSDPIWVGNETVTADNGPTGGTVLLPGDSIFVPVDSTQKIYVISSNTNQVVSWFGA